MFNEIVSNGIENIIVSNDRFHPGDSFLAGLDLILIAAGVQALLIVILNSLHLSIVQHCTRRTAVVYKAHGDTILNTIRHGVLVNNRAKHIHCSVYRSSGKTNIRRLRQCGMKEFGKAIALQHFVRLDHKLHVKVIARSVSFI